MKTIFAAIAIIAMPAPSLAQFVQTTQPYSSPGQSSVNYMIQSQQRQQQHIQQLQQNMNNHLMQQQINRNTHQIQQMRTYGTY